MLKTIPKNGKQNFIVNPECLESMNNYKLFIKSLPQKPGVYQMVNDENVVLYVGKAKNLKKRVASYFRTSSELKKNLLMKQVLRIEVTVTRDENEALLLENNLIKRYKPRYNVLFKDDKSYPYLVLSKHAFPRLFSYRGAKEAESNYFGPYPSAMAMQSTLHLVQKIFRIRSCRDGFFRHRSRPCLQYQIERCSAPCVGMISVSEYQNNVNLLKQLLRGKNQEVIKELTHNMREAALEKKYELAAMYRDQIENIRELQTPQLITKNSGDVDIIAFASNDELNAIQILYVRSGAIVGSKIYFSAISPFLSPSEILTAFIEQQYLLKVDLEDLPQKICVNLTLIDKSSLQKGLAKLTPSNLPKKHGSIEIIDNTKNKLFLAWLKMAKTNAEENLAQRKILREDYLEKFQALQKTFDLKKEPKLIECFDVSHTSGEGTVAACVTYNHAGAYKHGYRRFNITTVAANDDYGALKEALTRHFTYLQKHLKTLPDILLIDGGRGQLNIAREVLNNLNIDSVLLLAIAKDPNRKSGVDFIYCLEGGTAKLVKCSDVSLHFLQEIRNETHRFAITSHRNKRSKLQYRSILDDIPGLGPKKKLLLRQKFAGSQEMLDASLDDLRKISGINEKLAQKIYHKLHSQK